MEDAPAEIGPNPNDPVENFASAAQTFERLVQTIPEAAWTGPGLGDWDLRALVGHTARALITVETYLQQPAEHEDVVTSADYYGAIAPMLDKAGDRDAITERGRAAGRALGDDPAGYVRELVARAVPLAAAAGDPLITTIAGGMRLRPYLPTRTFELVVHSYDIAAATRSPDPAFSGAVLTEVATLAAAAAVARGDGAPLLRALTGRGELAPGFSVV